MILNLSKGPHMKVLCTSKGGDSLMDADIKAGNTRHSVFQITTNHEYTVYGVLFSGGTVSYLVQDDDNLPSWYPASLFRVSDGRVSQYWVSVDWSSLAHKYFYMISFPELVSSPAFFDSLSLGENFAREIFYKRKDLADLEFVDDSVEKTVMFVDENWVQCPLCCEAWEINSYDAMVRCPKCHGVFHRPQKNGGGPERR
jgi:hypothetical protein